MKPEFEIKYIEVQWYDKETITKVTESLNSLSLEYNDEIECFECETTIYPNTKGLRGQLAVRFLNNKPVNPYIELPDGEALHLSPIKDIDTSRTWWVVKESWDKQNKLWRHIGINTAGTLKLILQKQACHVLIGSVDFTRDQLETYLSSFKDDLWELILDDSSSIQADRPNGGIGVNDKVIECIHHLISHAEKVLKNPKVELREIQTLKPRKNVKPVNRTFMELVSKTNQRFLTSRATTPSHNVAENRYVLFALERCYRIIKQVAILSGNKAKRYAGTATKLQNQHDSFTDYITVDRDLVVKDLEAIKERCNIEYWQSRLSKRLAENSVSLDKQSHNQNEFYIRTQKHTTPQGSEEKNGFFIEILNNERWEKEKNKTTILSLEGKLKELVHCLEPWNEYKFTGMKGNRKETRKSVKYTPSCFSLVEVINPQGLQGARQKFEDEKQLGKQLNESGWTRKLSSNELEEQEKEKTALLNRINFYSKNQKLSKYVFEKVEPKQRQLLKIIKALHKLDIKPSSYFPNSMTFVQNPHYQGIHNGYKILRDVTNLADEELLVNLEEIDAIGLVNMPLMYERWCLLQIIKVLKESFRFVPKSSWKYQLIDAVKTNKIDIEISLSNTDVKRFITLTYEKTLDSGKRPDFVIDLEWYAEDDHQNKQPQKKRFVLDAKFYNETTFEKFGGLMGVADQLYNQKNYSESVDNPVFIIHPCKTSLPERVTSQKWGEYSFLGELPIGGSDLINHQYGGVFLSPIDRQLYADELQRLLGLFLQYKLEDSSTIGDDHSDDRTVSKPFCIRCGSPNLRKIEKSSGFYNREGKWVTRTLRSVWMQCNDCEQFISFNHCRNTETRLIKNGFYWTYHSARAIEPYNIKCPSCGEWGAW
ncbi:MAG: hypothetical protein KAH03_05950 [Cocleimonas sp.]|nr:hypothetical protein [Cocleimonas sp.]